MNILWQLYEWRSPFLDTVFGLITRLGEEMILIALFCTIYWCINKKFGYIMGVTFFMSSLVVQGLKIVYRIPRPWVEDPTFLPVGGSVRMATGYAFPSGHTQNAAAWLGSFAIFFKQIWVKIIAIVLALLVAFSRMYLGVHYMSDVVVSIIITFALVFIVSKCLPDTEELNWKKEIIFPAIMATLSVAVLIYAAVVYNQGVSSATLIRDAVLAGGAGLGFAKGMFIERMYIRFSVKSKNIVFQIIKLIIGIAGVLALQEGLRIPFRMFAGNPADPNGITLIFDGIRYFIMISWLTVFYPLIIRKFFEDHQGVNLLNQA